jgi:hypothetical protein
MACKFIMSRVAAVLLTAYNYVSSPAPQRYSTEVFST